MRALLCTRGAGIALAVLAAVCLVAGGIGAYADREVVDGDRFAARASQSLDDEAVREVIAEEIVGEALTKASPDLLAVRPVLLTAVEALTGSRQFRRLFELAVRDAHAVLVGERRTSLILDLDRAGGLALQALREASPAVAEQVPEDVDPGLAGLDESAFEPRAARVLRDTAVLGWPVLALGLLLLTASVLLAGDRRAQLSRAGMSLTAAGAVVWAAVGVTGLVLARHATELGSVPEDRVGDAISGVWLALAGDLRTWAWVVGLFGLCVSAIAARAVTPGDLVDAVRDRARHGLRATHKGVVAARGLVAVGSGVLLLLHPEGALRLAALGAGALLVFVGVGELSSGVERRHVRRAAGRPPSRRVVIARIVGMVAAIGAVALVALAVALPSSRPGREAAIATSGCNGSRALCDRRLDEVVIPATHNAFSAAEEPGWLFANQRHGIERQLRDGIRGLLLDVHLGVRQPDGRVRTDLRAEGSDRNRVAARLTPEALEVADRVVGGVGFGRCRAGASRTCATRSASSGPSRCARSCGRSTGSSTSAPARSWSCSSSRTCRRRSSSVSCARRGCSIVSRSCARAGRCRPSGSSSARTAASSS